MSYVTKAPEKTSTYTEDSKDVFGDLIPFAEPAWYHGYTSPYYKESHKRLRLAIRSFIEEHVIDNVAEWDEKKTTPAEVYKVNNVSGVIAR